MTTLGLVLIFALAATVPQLVTEPHLDLAPFTMVLPASVIGFLAASAGPHSNALRAAVACAALFLSQVLLVILGYLREAVFEKRMAMIGRARTQRRPSL